MASKPNQTYAKNDLDDLERRWLRCVELVDEPGKGATGHSGAYYHAQSLAMSAAFVALPDLIAELRASRKVVEKANQLVNNVALYMELGSAEAEEYGFVELEEALVEAAQRVSADKTRFRQ